MTDSEYLLGLAQNIKNLRKSKGITQKVLGERMGTNHTFIVRLEKGKQDCRISTLLAVSRALNVKLEELISV